MTRISGKPRRAYSTGGFVDYDTFSRASLAPKVRVTRPKAKKKKEAPKK